MECEHISFPPAQGESRPRMRTSQTCLVFSTELDPKAPHTPGTAPTNRPKPKPQLPSRRQFREESRGTSGDPKLALIHEENVGFTEYNVVCKAD